jgi:hypothetical protein
VLVCFGGPWYPQEIYDQHGHLLAVREWQQNCSRLQKLFRCGGVEVLDPRGQTLLGLSTDRAWSPRLFRATAPDGNEIGAVTVAGKGRGSILAARATVGYLKPPHGLWSKLGLGRNRGRYTLYDANDNEVGRITHRTSPLKPYNVIEIDQRASETLRVLVLAASAAVNYWLQPKGGA